MRTSPAGNGVDYFAKHQQRLARAWQACRTRDCWSPFPELPSKYPDAEAAQAAGRAAFDALLNRPFALDGEAPQPGQIGWLGAEVSPYTQAALGITYPQAALDVLFHAAKAAIPAWRDAGKSARIGVCMEVIERLYARLFEMVPAVMHTAGQSFNMSYTGSGVNALDRGIEALAHAADAMEKIPEAAQWQRRFGAATIRLDKRYKLMPRGVAVCFACASFPTWNAWPSMMASLATGNAVIVKPHPATVLPMALSVQIFRAVLREAGFDPNLVTLALDSVETPIGKDIIKHPDCAIVDFTGSVQFGQWVEQNAHPALCFTETAGCNTVVLESCDDLDAVLRSLATTMCMFSAQMCTSPQNLYLPAQGVKVRGRLVPFDRVLDLLAAAIEALTRDPNKAAMILATIQAPQTLATLAQMRTAGQARGRIVLDSRPYVHPEFPQARTATPLLIACTPEEGDLYRAERFGPIAFAIRCASAGDALAQATSDVKRHGGLTAFCYSTDTDFLPQAMDAYAEAGAQLTCNLTGPMPLNFAAAYSDFHVTGLNPAGNASLTDAAFVAGRFRIAQSRMPASGADTKACAT